MRFLLPLVALTLTALFASTSAHAMGNAEAMIGFYTDAVLDAYTDSGPSDLLSALDSTAQEEAEEAEPAEQTVDGEEVEEDVAKV